MCGRLYGCQVALQTCWDASAHSFSCLPGWGRSSLGFCLRWCSSWRTGCPIVRSAEGRLLPTGRKNGFMVWALCLRSCSGFSCWMKMRYWAASGLSYSPKSLYGYFSSCRTDGCAASSWLSPLRYSIGSPLVVAIIIATRPSSPLCSMQHGSPPSSSP